MQKLIWPFQTRGIKLELENQRVDNIHRCEFRSLEYSNTFVCCRKIAIAMKRAFRFYCKTRHDLQTATNLIIR